ncbi:hypothetical protein [Aneurinibacillus tyrosinisolvens]|uniref:hypothetical protein n=1 Tax=Aneurinibacillus tyrosinisolvens TaxID=1443435 RepID=UPI00063F116D|nr:hypothetical protein [Aneurinibacillus tyrosinisolvens]
MIEKNNILLICQKFKEKECGLVEFQKRIETSNFPEELVEFKQWILNELEEIRFTKLETNFYDYGLEIVNSIIKKLE